MLELPKPIIVERRSGWRFAFRFWKGLPPNSVIEDLSAYSATITLTPQSMPDAVPIELSTDLGSISMDGGAVNIIVPRGQNAYWPADDYDLLGRIFRTDEPADRYVFRSVPNKSPLKVITPPGGVTPIPGGPAGIMLPLAFTSGYTPGEALPGYPVLDTVLITGGGSKYASLTRPTGIVTQTIRRDSAAIGLATMNPATCGPGPVFYGSVAMTVDPFTFSPGFLDWLAPAAADATFNGGSVTLAAG